LGFPRPFFRRRRGDAANLGGVRPPEDSPEARRKPGTPRTRNRLAIHEALHNLEAINPQAAELVKLRYFAGFTIPETADLLGISPRKANQVWTYARAWLATAIADGM
jgi:DNA-directed RNA polymerase specialized sigma24 family protein